jgi:RNA polymerase sigma-70 factor (ECF subfamily)
MSDEVTSSFQNFIHDLEEGKEGAWTRVFNLYAQRLLGLARSRLSSHQLRPRVDADDVLNSVFRSFFHRCTEGQFDLKNWENLWGLLVVITLRKCNKQIKYSRADRRDVRREIAVPSSSDDSTISWEFMARDPTPDEVAQLLETVEQLLRDLDERERQIVELRLQEYKVEEISQRVGRTERTVQRVLHRVRKRLERMREE